MADHVPSSTAEVLKRFAQKVNSASTRERVTVLREVAKCVDETDLPEPAFKGILKLLYPTIGVYRDAKSLRAALKLLQSVAKKQPQFAVRYVATLLSSLGEFQKKTVVESRSSAGTALVALSWTCVCVIVGFREKSCSDDDLQKLVGIQVSLVYGALFGNNRNISSAVARKMAAVWRSTDDPLMRYGELLQKGEPTMHHVCLMSVYMKYLAAVKNENLLTSLKEPFLEVYMKQVIGSRTSPPPVVLRCGKDILRYCSHDIFKSKILPFAQKALLRNPEIIVGAFGEMLAGLQLDLSQYGMDIIKPLAAQMLSKETITRDEASNAISNLASQCSDTEVVEKIVRHLFGVLNGSEGKLTLTEQKYSTLQAIGNMSKNTVSGAGTLQNLSTTVAELFIPLLSSEVHEGTLIQALSMLSLWCVKFYTSVPEKLLQWFKKGMGLKSSTSPVRNAYIQCMNASFHGDTLLQAVDMIPTLIQSLEKAASQPTQSQLVTEAVSAANILIKLSLVDINAESKLGPLWNIILDSNKQLLVNEKYLSSVGNEALEGVVTLSEKLILEYPQKMTDKIARPYYKAIVYCLTRKPYSVRKFTLTTVKRILSLLGGTAISLSLIDMFGEIVSTQKAIDLENIEDSDKENVLDLQKYISPRILSQALASLSNVPKVDPKDAESIAKATLVVAHHPCVVAYNPGTWTDILFQLHLDAKNFIRNNKDHCISIASSEGTMSENVLNAIQTLVRIAPEEMLPPYVSSVTQLLSNPEFCLVTRDEYGIFLCSEGELYDKTLISNLQKATVQDQNIRRENKLYSYKEQMADLELRKELEKKKGKPAEAPLKLTKKQEEQVQTQLQKESEIRAKIRALDIDLCRGCQLLQALIDGNSSATCLYMKDLCRAILPLLKSPLAAPRSSEILVKLGSSSFSDPELGSLVSNATVRLLQPECECNPQWTEEPQTKQATRIVNILYSQSVPQNMEDSYDEDTDSDTNLYSAANFAFIFYFLNCVIMNCGEAVGGDDNVVSMALKVIGQHAQIRLEKDDFERKYDPSLLPRREIFLLLLRVIGSSVTKIQQLANTALVEMARCVSGGEGCATATAEDINALLDSLTSTCTACRESSLQALHCLVPVLPNIDDNFELGLKISQRIWVASFDVDENVKKLAQSLIEDLDLEEPYEDMCSPLVDDVIHDEEIIRQAAAEALAATLNHHHEYITPTIDQLLQKYEEKSELPPPILDDFGRVIADQQQQDPWPARCGIAMALEKISPIMPQEQLLPLFHFYVQKGLRDRSVDVRSHMRNAALAAVNVHGKDNVSDLLPVFEDFLSNAPGTASYDAVRQSIVILMGSLAKHLDKDNPKVKPIVGQLIGALSTPSQEVQQSVANCLPPLVPAIKSTAPNLVKQLLDLLLDSENYGERKGAAYGLAGLVRGLGITALKQLDIMTTLEEAVKDKKNPRRREGALFAYEMMCTMLGKLFEPYVVHILPHLLLCFGDANQYVREAADETSKAVMGMLTAHGVKLVLPSLLKGLEEDSWRTKAGAVELLGSMAYCAPKQLSACLPNIVPKLTEVLTDSHVRVQKAGAQALQQIGNVIRNPEILAIVPVLLEALQDPAKKTFVCLQSLLETKFVHFIDAASLALIMPVVERAFLDRVTETRKMAAQIIGNMYSLTDQKDLDPYIEKVIPGLKQSLLDPVPEVRTVSARALGAMVKGMGSNKFDELMNWLMETLKSESSSVDRSGAAQGLSEVVGGLGLADLHKIMSTVIPTAERQDIPSHVRDGYIMMYIFLPVVFKDDFKQYIGPILPSILQALADESEYVRDTALRAGQRIISMYASTAIELLLPELERGLFDDNWRIRYSSVQLLGDLLYSVSGVSGKMSTESAGEDDNFGTESSQQLILRVLGTERRNRVLSGLYMGRSDTALLVRQAALHVWKVIVANTPRTLREILGTLFELLLTCLASTSHDKRTVAARTLGDLVRKLGERVLPEIIPILNKGLDSDHSDQRQGVCIGLSEIMASTQKDHVIVYADSLIPTVRRALTDSLPEVRAAAANTFNSLHSNIGSRALDEILPDLLEKLGDEDMSERALDGLKQVMTVKSREVLPYLVPKLIAPPVNTRALSFLSAVAGDALTKHLPKILPALQTSLSTKSGTPEEAQEQEYCKTVVLSVTDEIGVRTIMEELLSGSQSKNAADCRASVLILHAFCEGTRADYNDYLPQLFKGLIGLFVRSEQEVLIAAWECLNVITKAMDTSDMLDHIHNVRQAIRYAASDHKGQELPGFSIPKKGITPVLPIFREGILNGSQDIKEQAAVALGELINLTSAEALKPSVVNITGPLIRILGDRFVYNVKTAVLETLTILLAKVGVLLKPFLPQLQTTFVKALNDPNRPVRLKAAAALGKLIVIHTRVDPLFTELFTGIKSAEDPSVRETMLQSLRFCLSGAGEKMSPATRKQLNPILLGLIGSPEDATRSVASACTGVLCLSLPEEELTDLLIQHLLDTSSSVDWTLRHGRGTALGIALKEGAEKIWIDQYKAAVKNTISSLIESDRIPLCLCGYRCLGYLINNLVQTNEDPSEYCSMLVKGMKHDSNDVKQLIGGLVSFIISSMDKPLDPSITKIFIPSLVMGTKERNTVVKSNSEYALISLLHLRDGDTYLKTVQPLVDTGMQAPLQELISKTLRKLCSQPEPPKDQIDDTILI